MLAGESAWEKAMTGPEIMRAFERWRGAKLARCRGCDRGSALASEHACIASGLIHATPEETYPLYVATNGPYAGQWYVRERMPGTRVWKALDEGGFELINASPQVVPFWGRTLDSFSDETITKVRQSEGGTWYASLDTGPDRYVSDPDFAVGAATRHEAVRLCAARIRADARGEGKYAPHDLLVPGRYDFSYRLAKHWAAKEQATRVAGHCDPSEAQDVDSERVMLRLKLHGGA